MGKNKYTELDKLFQSKLKDGNVENGEWNNPTDDAFFSAMNQLQPEVEAEEKKAVWWPYLFLLFIPILFLTIRNTDQVNELKTDLDNISDFVNQAEASSKNDLDAKVIEPKEQSVQEANAPSLEKENKVSSKSNSQVQKTNASSSLLSKRAVAKKKNVENNLTSVNVFDRSNDLVTNVTRGSYTKATDLEVAPSFPSQKENIESLIALNRDNTIQAFEIGEREKEEFSDFQLAIVPERKDQAPLGAYAFLDLNLNTIRMSGMEPSGFSLTGYDKSYLGYELGLGLIQDINEKWSINYTASYRHVMNKSFYESEFMFDEDNLITTVDGDLIYQLFSEMQTPTGAYVSNENLSFRDEMDDKTMMDQNADIELIFNFVSVGAKPRYDLIQKNGFKLFAEAGLNINYLVHYCQTVDLKFYHENEMMMGNSEDIFSMNNLNKFSFTSSLGLGLEYNIGDKFFSGLKLGSSRSLNSIKQLSSATDETRTYIDNLGLSLTAGYRL